MKIKTIIFDMDGTLLNSQHQVPIKTFAAIKKAQDQGIKFVLASGRGVEQMKSYARDLGIDYIVAHNGSVVFSFCEDKTLFQSSIPNDLAKRLFVKFSGEKRNVIFYPNQKPFLLKESPNYEKISTHFGVSPDIPTIDDIENVQKVILIDFLGCEVTLPLIKEYKKQFPDFVEIRRSSPRTIDFNPKGISKASGIIYLSDILGIDPNQTVVFGDAGNDVEMMKWAKYSYGMANCVEEVKNVAKEMIGDNNSNAISQKLHEIIKGNKGE